MITKETAKNVLRLNIEREIKYLFKYQLSLLDDFERDDCINANNKAFYRSKILDMGNSALRNINSQLEAFDVDFGMKLSNSSEDNQ